MTQVLEAGLAEALASQRNRRDAAQRAAKALAHEALVRQSTDNVCVIVVDLEAHVGGG